MSNFQQALNLMKQGKKIRRKSWEIGHYWFYGKKFHIKNSIEKNPEINIKQIEAEDWEVYEEEIVKKEKKLYDLDLHFKELNEEEHKKIMRVYFEILTKTKGLCSSNTEENKK